MNGKNGNTVQATAIQNWQLIGAGSCSACFIGWNVESLPSVNFSRSQAFLSHNDTRMEAKHDNS